MLKEIVGALLVLHGLVHLLYFGQSQKLFELQTGLTWPGGSWALSGAAGENATRTLASASCLIASVGFAAGGAGLLLGQPWWRAVAVGSAALSIAIFVLFWDGRTEKLDAKGGVGLVLDLAILAAVLTIQ